MEQVGEMLNKKGVEAENGGGVFGRERKNGVVGEEGVEKGEIGM